MKIVISGASGFVAKRLRAHLAEQKEVNSVVLISRQKKLARLNDKESVVSWDDIDAIDWVEVDAVFHTAGEPLAQWPWSEAALKKMRDSRCDLAKILLDQIAHHAEHRKRATKVFCFSALGFFGTEVKEGGYNESDRTAPDGSFSYDLTHQLEDIFTSYASEKIVIYILRLSIVLDHRGGFLKALFWPFFLGCGAILGQGHQAFSWIALEDLIQILWLLLEEKGSSEVSIVHCAAPQKMSQREFARLYANFLHRPLWVKIPAQILELFGGQMAKELLLNGVALKSEVLEKRGFKWIYPDLKSFFLRKPS